MTRLSRKIAATAVAALGLTSLTPVQQGAALMAAGAAALWASPAMAQGTVPGVGIVIKKKPGNAPIIVPSDSKGEVRLSGLEPGEYSVQVFGGAQETVLRAGPDGRLAFVAYEDVRHPGGKGTATTPIGGRRHPPGLPVVKRWVEAIPFDTNAAAPPPPAESNPAAFCPNGNACGWNVLDLSTNSWEKIVRVTGTSDQSAVAIMVEREKRGPYTSIEDFARRLCPTNAITIDRGWVMIGNFIGLLGVGSSTKRVAPGFQCRPGNGGQFSLYGKSYSYAGQATLVR